MAISDDYGVRSASADLIDVSDALDALETFNTNIKGGWIKITDSWSYASSTTITVPSGAASLYQKGDKLKINNTTTKYFYITNVADTLLTVYAGTDYTVANSAISEIYISRAVRPLNFPVAFNWTPTTNSSAGTWTLGSITLATFTIDGSYCNIELYYSGTLASSSAAYLTFTAPVAGANLPSGAYQVGASWAEDNSTVGTGLIFGADDSATFRAYKSANATWGTTGTKYVITNFRYRWA